ncbi:hypothetical protein [Legionella feeleii]|uniref:hypothetical protein n=1 Tax=Legionella feeleii TaxID=453 RepID=UPI0015F13803|nr:hypothetical protein [Legionella feeleii]
MQTRLGYFLKTAYNDRILQSFSVRFASLIKAMIILTDSMGYKNANQGNGVSKEIKITLSKSQHKNKSFFLGDSRPVFSYRIDFFRWSNGSLFRAFSGGGIFFWYWFLFAVSLYPI